MALLLAPYNDSMRLGMGFNSYTQTMCIDGAVEVTKENQVNVENPSQIVTYSSKFVERLSDIVSSMNISYSAAIKKGTIEVSGNGNSIDEDKIKASDINLVISVQVINQTTTLKDVAEFKPLPDIPPGDPRFNECFGDCYISGFIEGGDFSSIISMRAIDRSKTNSVVRSIKRMTRTTTEPEDFSMDSYSNSFSDGLSGSESLKETETTISVNWMGGGQIKDPNKNWEVKSVYDAAASFPSFVAKTPQKTWAILTKYKANRSFNQKVASLALRPLEYDAVISYTAELFNNFMEYKQLVKKVQDIISHGELYTAVFKPNAIPIHIGTLVAVRSALRTEMNKIVSVVNLLSRKPELLSQSNSFDVVSKNALVRKIVDEAILLAPDSNIIVTKASSKPATSSASSTKIPEPAAPAGDFQRIDHSDASHTPAMAPAPEEPDEQQMWTPKPSSTQAKSSSSPSSESSKIDLSALIAPEVWADLLPIKTGPDAIDKDDTAALDAAKTFINSPPKDDAAVAFLSSNSPNKLKILSAICGIHDVTQTIQDRVKDNTSLTIPVNEINSLTQSNSAYDTIPKPFVKNLAFVYQHGDGPMRVCSATYDEQSTESIQINTNNSSQYAEVKARSWNKESWALIASVFGGRVLNSDDTLKRLEEQIRRNFNSTFAGQRRITMDSDTLGLSTQPGGPTKVGIIFFKSAENGTVRAAAALEGQTCILSDQPQMAVLTKETIKEVIKEVPQESLNIIRRGGAPQRYSCFYGTGELNVSPSEDPFLKFNNGVFFKFQPDGNFVIYRGAGEVLWACDATSGGAGSLVFQDDGNLVTYNAFSQALWSTETHWRGKALVLSSTAPFIEVLDDNNRRIYGEGGRMFWAA